MLPSRFGVSQPSTSSIRKSRVEGKPSLLPKPRRLGSTDRLSSEMRRPSATGRSSSADPPRATFGGGRLSKEASTSQQSWHARSRSQQSDRFGQSSMTPLRPIPHRVAASTPRTPSEDRANRSWQASLDRALAFVTVKDQRPISNVAWQRAESARVQEALNGFSFGAGAPLALVRPLVIARFVSIAGTLLNAIIGDVKLSNDNYVTKLPHIAKRLLYPGTVSKSWLKTVNTLHAFPQAVALVGYLVDLVHHIEAPVTEDWLCAGKDHVTRLRREYTTKCWFRFQDPEPNYDDFKEEYLQKLNMLLGNDEEKIENLQQAIKEFKSCLEDEAEAAARAEEARLVGKREALLAALRAEKEARRQVRAEFEERLAAKRKKQQEIKRLDAEIERATAEMGQLKLEVESQSMSVEERAKLRAELEYSNRVLDSKRAVAEQIEKVVRAKEVELAQWQTIALASCQKYKEGLIPLSAQFPDVAALAVDENELMSKEGVARVGAAVEALRLRAQELADKRAQHDRNKTALARKMTALLDETRAKIEDIKSSVDREQELLDADMAKEAAEATAWSSEHQELTKRIEELKARQEEYARVDAELQFWQKQDETWRTFLSKLQAFIEAKREESKRLLEEGRQRRVQVLADYIREWISKISD